MKSGNIRSLGLTAVFGLVLVLALALAGTRTILRESRTVEREVKKSDAEWRKELSPEEYHVCREKGTERPFAGAYTNCKTPGIYCCKACGKPLFDSDAKFDSGTGWPSFFTPVAPDAVDEETDNSLFMTRTEALCKSCGAHLGHVFPDGPKPTGLRYCINSVSLSLEPKTDPK